MSLISPATERRQRNDRRSKLATIAGDSGGSGGFRAMKVRDHTALLDQALDAQLAAERVLEAARAFTRIASAAVFVPRRDLQAAVSS